MSSRVIIFFLLVLFPSIASGESGLAEGKPSPTSKARALSNQLVQEAQTQYLTSQFTYTYDNVGNRTSMTSPQGTQTYTYDPLYQLRQVTGAQSHSYQYDSLGNRQVADGTLYTPNPLNQYSTVGGTPYTYDANGNLTGDGTKTYGYDFENRLTSVTGPGLNVQYAYDGFGRRVKKTVNGVVTYYLHDGDQVIEERGSGNVLKATYTYGPGIDEVLTMNRNAQSFFYFYDGLGSVTDLTNAQGEVVESYSYDPYGQPVTPSTIGNPYMFTGREYDSETGLYHYRNRTYSSILGRFLQRDPLSYQPDINLYRYVENNPINWIDPLGLLTLAAPLGPGAIIDRPGKLPPLPQGDIVPPIEYKPNIFVPSPPGSTVIADPVPQRTGPIFDTSTPSNSPNPGHPPSHWIPIGKNKDGFPQWRDPTTQEIWTRHDEPGHGPPHWEIGGPADRARGIKGKQEWWPDGGVREPKPPGGERMSLPGPTGSLFSDITPNEKTKNE